MGGLRFAATPHPLTIVAGKDKVGEGAPTLPQLAALVVVFDADTKVTNVTDNGLRGESKIWGNTSSPTQRSWLSLHTFKDVALKEGLSMRVIRCLMLTGALLLLPLPGCSQAPPPRPPGIDPNTIGTIGSANSRLGDVMDENGETASMHLRVERLRKQQRRDRMVASANRLLELTKQLEADIAAHPELTAENARKLDDIAKLAHEVKSRMVEY
jgi:hypothetical protein